MKHMDTKFSKYLNQVRMQKKLKTCVIIIFLGVIFFLSCRKEVSCEGCSERNQPPVAAAGNDQSITLPTDSSSLDGSSSNDPDGSINKWLWKKISGPLSYNFSNATGAITVVKDLSAGTYLFELTVTDNGGLSDKDTVSIIVAPVLTTNHPPVANAGPDQTITLPTNSVTLDGNGSVDPDNNITNYVWAKISGPSSFNIDNANAVQTQVTNLVEGVYQFELKVTDAGMLVSIDTIGIKVFSAGNTSIIFFTDQVWINLCYQPDIPGACWINSDSPSYGFNINDTANILPDSPSAILGVWVKMDTSSVWEQVPHKCWQFPDPYPQSSFTYCITPNSLSIWSWFFSWENLAGRKADVKIAF
jgi:hypothetical protein